MSDERPTQKAQRECAEWLRKCLRFGWSRSGLDMLEALWWQYHDRHGRLMNAPASGAARDPEGGGEGAA